MIFTNLDWTLLTPLTKTSLLLCADTITTTTQQRQQPAQVWSSFLNHPLCSYACDAIHAVFNSSSSMLSIVRSSCIKFSIEQKK